MSKIKTLSVVIILIGMMFSATEVIAQKTKKEKKKSKTKAEVKNADEKTVTVSEVKAAKTTTIEFKAGNFKKCGDTLVVDNHLLIMCDAVCDTTNYCYFGNNEDQLWLYPGNLGIYFYNKTRSKIKEIKIHYYDGCPSGGCTSAKLYNADWMLIKEVSHQPGQVNVLTLDSFVDPMKLVLSGGESSFQKIEITYFD